MTGFTREQLDALRRQIEEDYRLDMAAIDRLERRLGPSPTVSRVGSSSGATSVGSGNSLSATTASVVEMQGVPLPESRAQKPDELTGTLRSMFSSYSK